MLVFSWENAISYKIGIFKKNAKNRRKIFPKPSQNPSQIDQKSKKIDKKSHDGLRSQKNAKKWRKSAKKDEK